MPEFASRPGPEYARLPRPPPTPTRPRGFPPGGPPTLVYPLQRPVLYCAGGHLVPNFFFRIACGPRLRPSQH